MDSVEHYYNSRIRLFFSCALLLTWDFFGKQSKTNIDFEYLNVTIATNSIPFLLALLIIFHAYTFSFHFKIINPAKKIKLSLIDYYITLIVSFSSLIINFFYQVDHSPSQIFLSNTLEPSFYMFATLTDLIFIYFITRKSPHNRKHFKGYLIFSWIFLIVVLISLVYTIFSLRKQYHLNTFETIYFYSFQIIVTLLFVWAAIPKRDKKSNEALPISENE